MAFDLVGDRRLDHVDVPGHEQATHGEIEGQTQHAVQDEAEGAVEMFFDDGHTVVLGQDIQHILEPVTEQASVRW